MRVDGPLRTNNGEVTLAAVRAGVGIAALPRFICGPDLAVGRLASVLEDWLPPPAGTYAVYPHNRHLSAKVRAFVDFLIERFGRSHEWHQPATTTARGG